MSKVIVVGGGASGMMAAIWAGKAGHQVELYEKNEKLGKKLFITGKGRCNITNACDTEDLFEHIISNSKFLYSGFYGFTNFDMMQFVETIGCKIKTERGNRVFPQSDHSSDVIKVLVDQLKEQKVKIRLRTTIKDIVVYNEEVKGIILNDDTVINGDKVIIATGGISYPLTGSTGDGYKIAERNGHKITKLSPALVPFEIEETWCKELQGVSLKNVEAKIIIEEKEIYQNFGEMLFTHYGVSGPLLLSGSSYYAKFAKGKSSILRLDLKPALSLEQLDKRILRDFEESKNKQFRNAISGLFPSKLIPIMIRVSNISPEKKVNEITKEERQYFVNVIKNWDMKIIGLRGYSEAIITQGGITVKEINPSTMESKIISGLYFTGEVLDLDGLTGGYNLQIAWSTGYLAGNSIE